MNEVNVLKSLSHPCIPTIYDIEEDKEYSYIIEEFLEGVSLKNYRLSCKTINDKEILSLASQVCDVIQYLHNQRETIIYLDLKPENIMYYKGQIKLLDFGTALFLKQRSECLLSYGTRGYAAPEQLDSLGCVDERSDIYSIGALLFFLVTGKRYQKSALSIKWSWILLSNNRLYKIIEKCLRQNPSERFQSINQIKKGLYSLQFNGEINKQQSAMSFNAAIAGSIGRVGTTHISLRLSCFLQGINRSVVYIENNENSIADSVVCNKESYSGRWIHNCKIISQHEWEVSTEREKYPFRITDFGELSEKNLKVFLSYEHRIIVIGTKAWEMKKTLYWLNKLCDCKEILYLANMSDAKSAENIRYMIHPEMCLRVPVLSGCFDSSIHREEQVFLDGICTYLSRNIIGKSR